MWMTANRLSVIVSVIVPWCGLSSGCLLMPWPYQGGPLVEIGFDDPEPLPGQEVSATLIVHDPRLEVEILSVS